MEKQRHYGMDITVCKYIKAVGLFLPEKCLHEVGEGKTTIPLMCTT